jgi:KAP family P-loop domain
MEEEAQEKGENQSNTPIRNREALEKLARKGWNRLKKELSTTSNPNPEILVKEDQAKRQYIERSTSVEAMEKDLAGEPRYAYELVDYIYKTHSDYAGSTKWQHPDSKELLNEQKKSISTWIDEVSSLYSPKKLERLHVKLVILGLALVDEMLGKQLTKSRVFEDVKGALKEDFESLLNEKGMALWDTYFVEHDTVRTLADDPAIGTDVDILGRKTFARALVERMIQIREEENLDKKESHKGDKKRLHKKGAFLMHIHGPWGSGKSSLLNFMRHELEEEIEKEGKNKWIVVMFNAGQHQRTGPPWWSLMDAVFKRGVSSLQKISLWRCITIILWEYSWRLWKGTSPILWGVTIISLFLALGIWSGFININSLINPENSNSNILTDNMITASLAFIVSLLMGLRAISTSLVPGSARAAEQFMEFKGDPMQQITRHFDKLVHMMKQPVAIFVDDLDRCNDSYTVEFLERIQTLFREAGVFYIVAADRRWLFSSYKKAYDTFKNDIDEPGRPLSHLFLEKTFQLSVTLPRLSPELQRQYWEYLLQTDRYDKIKEKLDAAKKEAKRDLKDLKVHEIIAKTEERTDDFVKKQALKEEAVIELAKKERKPVTEQFLKPYAKFLESNPRAMKRLVNAYSLARDIRILEELKIEREKLALWTIVTMRWPLLAGYLEEDCTRVKPIVGVKPIIGEENLDGPGINEDIKKLLIDKDVIDVIKGDGVGGPLDEDAIRNLIVYEHPSSAS